MSNIFRKYGWWWFHINGFIRGPYIYSKQAMDGLDKARKSGEYYEH